MQKRLSFQCSSVLLCALFTSCDSNSGNGTGGVGPRCQYGTYLSNGSCAKVPSTASLGTAQYQSSFRAVDELRGVVNVGSSFYVLGNRWGAADLSTASSGVLLGGVETKSFVQALDASGTPVGAEVSVLDASLVFESAAFGTDGTNLFAAGSQWTSSGVQGFISKMSTVPARASSLSIVAAGGGVGVRALAVAGSSIVVGGVVTGSLPSAVAQGKRDGFVCIASASMASSSCLQMGSSEDDEVTAVAVDGTYAYVALRSFVPAVAVSTEGAIEIPSKGFETEIFKVALSDLTKFSLAKITGAGDETVAGLSLDGNVLYVGGTTTSTLVANAKGGIFVTAFDTSSGQVASGFPIQFGSSGTDRIEGLVWDSLSSRLLMVGTTLGNFSESIVQTGAGDGFVVAISSSGERSESKQFGTVLFDAAHAICPISGGGVVVVGETAGNITALNQGGRDGFWAKISL
jgi:hypothetical protein